MAKIKLNSKIINFDKPHRANMIKVCKNCERKYYPRANGYQDISEYCGQECYRERRWGKKI